MGIVAATVTAGALIALVGFLAASSTGHRPSASPGATSNRNRVAAASSAATSAELVDAPDTTGTVNLGGITAGLDHTGLTVDFGAPGGPQLKPDIAVGAEPGEAIDGLVVPLVRGMGKGKGQVSTHTPTIGSIKSIGVNLGVEGGLGLTVEEANVVTVDPTYVLTGRYYEGKTLVPARLEASGTYACAEAGLGLSVSVTDPSIANGGSKVVDNIVCDGTTRKWSVSFELAGDPSSRQTVKVTAALSGVANAERNVLPSKF